MYCINVYLYVYGLWPSAYLLTVQHCRVLLAFVQPSAPLAACERPRMEGPSRPSTAPTLGIGIRIHVYTNIYTYMYIYNNYTYKHVYQLIMLLI